jgi:ABC-type methionine transport system ATPase subunit
MPGGPASERGIYLLVIQGTIASSPIIQQVAFQFGLRAYVLMGSVGESAEGRKGELVVEFAGLARDVDGAVSWLEERGARIDRLDAAR